MAICISNELAKLKQKGILVYNLNEMELNVTATVRVHKIIISLIKMHLMYNNFHAIKNTKIFLKKHTICVWGQELVLT